MKIGILSDTHGDIGRSIRALELLLARDCRAILHCGDIGSEEVWLALVTLCRAHEVPLHAVFGNVDAHEPELSAFKNGNGVTLWGTRAELELAGKRIAILHGHEEARLIAAIESGAFDYVFTGHTHVAEQYREGRTHVINPGAVYRAHPPSVATVELETDTVDYIELN